MDDFIQNSSLSLVNARLGWQSSFWGNQENTISNNFRQAANVAAVAMLRDANIPSDQDDEVDAMVVMSVVIQSGGPGIFTIIAVIEVHQHAILERNNATAELSPVITWKSIDRLLISNDLEKLDLNDFLTLTNGAVNDFIIDWISANIGRV